MQDLIKFIRAEIPDVMALVTSSELEDKGLSGLHITTEPILLKGLRISPEEKLLVQNEINKNLDANPVKVRLRDGKKLTIFSIDLVVSPKSMVYLADILDGEFIS